MRILRLGLLAAVAALGSACMMAAPVVPPPAVVQTYKAPLDIDNNDTPRGSKRGEASTHNILGLVAWGDASIRAAATHGGLERIQSADYEFFSVVLYSRYTTVVYGD